MRLLGGDPHGLVKLDEEARVDVIGYWLAVGHLDSPVGDLFRSERGRVPARAALGQQLQRDGAAPDAVSWWLED